MASTENHDEFVPDPQVARELGVTLMTLWRYDHDPGLDFPPAVKIRNKNYRSRLALETWKETMVKRALQQRAERPPRTQKTKAADREAKQQRHDVETASA